MTYRQRLSLFIIVDSCIVAVAIFMSWYLVSADIVLIKFPLISSLVLILSHHLFSIKFKLYKKVWEYASVGELLVIFKVVSYTVLTGIIFQQILIQDVYFRLLTVTWLLHLILIGGSRFIWRMHRDSKIKKADHQLRTLIIGAGSAGTMVARQLLKKQSTLQPIAFIDDNVNKHHLDIMGLPIIGGVKDIVDVVEELDIANIVISIPSLDKQEMNEIIQECAKTNAKTKILPLMEDIMTGKVSVTQFQDVQVEDLLGRDPVNMDIESINEYIKGKTVLVTGAGGSIGSEIARQISKFNPEKLVLLGHGENSIYTIEMELKESFQNSDIQFITEIADVKDEHKIMSVMRSHQPDVVYHAAAHKHVPLMERNPEEAVKNNVIGTRNVAQAASWNNVKVFVMISTDKAVNPTSVMGASKKIAEMIIQNMDKHSQTKFVAVRFGNVLGSRGSVIPLFKRQIEKGGPVTVTHPDMVRYFMTIPEASRLVIQAGALANGGEVFVLDMGDPVKIVELAKNLIQLSGYRVDEIGIEFTGIRPGEKLFEELLTKDEIHEEQLYPKIYIGKTTSIYLADIEKIMKTYASLDRQTLREELLYLANKDISEPEKTAMLI
jgi:FlaA1/EpsC-like NDP-sugar epimerase